MEKRFKLRLSRLFRSSFSSCISRNMSDVIEKAVFIPQDHQTTRPVSQNTRPFPSICRPNIPQTTTQNISISLPRRRVSETYSPSNPFHEFRDCLAREKIKKTKKKKKKKTNKNAKFLSLRSSLIENSYSNRTWWYSSEEDEESYNREDEIETLYESSDSRRRRQRNQVSRRRRADDRSCEVGLLPLEGKVKDSFAVVKKSSDPYNDFRTSMLEMIVEKQIFGAADLEQLLQTFLSLNSFNHHRVIVEVFTEIWEALFSDWGS